MIRFRFTKKKLSEFKTEKRVQFIFDEEVRSLACLVTRNGSKSFFVVKKHKGKKKEIRLGAIEEIPIPKARQLAAETILKLVSGITPDAGKPGDELTLNDTFNDYIEYTKAHRKPKTVEGYQWQWRKHLEKWGGEELVTSLKRNSVTKLHLQIGKEHGKTIANRVVALLRAILNYAIKERELGISNPASGISFYKEKKRSRRLEVEELPAFFKAVREEPNVDVRDWVMLALFTGARKSYTLAMRWADLNLDRGLWVIRAEESKTNEELPVVLSGRAVQILQDRRERITGDYVFPGKRGAAHMVDPKAGWQRILDRAGLGDLRMHDLRRSLASFQIDTGTPLEVIQKTLGHGNKTTTEIYARMALDPVRASIEKATEAILEQAEES